MRDVKLSFTTDASGAATAISPDLSGTKLVAVEWIDGDLTDGVDGVFSIIDRHSGIDRALITLTDANSDAYYHVGAAVYGVTGAAVTNSYTPPIIDGKIKLVVASGGSAKSGAAYLFLR